jgi:hypothetical protein
MFNFRARKLQEQPARIAQLRNLLEAAYGRPFNDAEVLDAAIVADEFLLLITDPDTALQSQVSPRQFLFAIAASKTEPGPATKAAIHGIAATAARKGV